MNNYIKSPNDEPSFDQEGLTGHNYSLNNDKIEIYRVNVSQGHDTFIISKEITHLYHVINGKGTFTIEKNDHHVEQGDLIEVPPGVEYTYAGEMELLLIMQPPWFEGNEEITRPNPAVND